MNLHRSGYRSACDDVIKSECPLQCTGCVTPDHPCMTAAMKLSRGLRFVILRKTLILFVILFSITTFIYLRPLDDHDASHPYVRNDGEINGEEMDDAALYEVNSEFVNLKNPRDETERKSGGVVDSLRSLIGLKPMNKDGSSKTEIRLDSHAQHLLEILEVNLYKNETNSYDLASSGGVAGKPGIHLLSPDEGEVDGEDAPRCVPRKSRDRMLNLYGSSYNPNYHPFVGQAEAKTSNMMSLPAPFGFHNSETILKKALSVVKLSDLPVTKGKSCTRCVVVGNGGIIKKTSLGKTIDDHDVVIRLNDAPTKGYEVDVGSRTTLRMAYPESSFQTSRLYDDHWLYVMIVFKPSDLEWITDVAAGKKVRPSLHFWKSVARSVPKPADEFRIFNPLIIRETATLIGFTIGNGRMNKNVPTTGSFAIAMATRLCDEVSVVGFGYTEDKPLHYYDALQMKVVKKSWTHNIDQEKRWLHKLVQQGVIHDLTGGIGP